MPKPELIDFDGDFRVNMYRKAEDETGINRETNQTTQATQATQTTQTTQTTQINEQTLSDEDKAILLLVKNNPSMSQREYAMELGWTVDLVKYYLRKLKTQNLIQRFGNSHSGYWVVSAEVSKWLN